MVAKIATDGSRNTLKDLIAFLGTPERPVSPAEFRAFWLSCSDEDKAYYLNAEI